MGLLMSAEIKEKEVKRKWGMEMSDSLKTTLTIRILLCYVVFDTVADFLMSYPNLQKVSLFPSGSRT